MNRREWSPHWLILVAILPFVIFISLDHWKAKMLKSTVISRRLLALDAVSLGRLVLNLDSPEQDFHQSPSLALEPADILVKWQSFLEDVRYQHSGAKLILSLASLLDNEAGFDISKEDRLKASTITTHQLKNSMEKFAAICTDVQTRKWFETIPGRGRRVYMIVGFETLTDGVLTLNKSYGVSTGVSAAVAATGTPLDPSVGVEVAGGRGRSLRITAMEEQVCAVQYRKVDFEWFRSRDLDKTSLENGNRWKFYWGTRDEEYSGDEEDADDVLGAKLMGSLKDEDMRGMERLVVSEEEEVIYVPSNTCN
jgi:hypothetical protein